MTNTTEKPRAAKGPARKSRQTAMTRITPKQRAAIVREFFAALGREDAYAASVIVSVSGSQNEGQPDVEGLTPVERAILNRALDHGLPEQEQRTWQGVSSHRLQRAMRLLEATEETLDAPQAKRAGRLVLTVAGDAELIRAALQPPTRGQP